MHQIPVSIKQMISKLEASPRIDVNFVKEVLLASEVSIEDVIAFSDFNHSVRHSYGRKLVYKSEKFEIMVMSWCPGDFSAIHNHGKANWGALKTYGELEHTLYHIEYNQLKISREETISKGSILGVNESLIHQMGNPSKQEVLSLHIYGQHTDTDNATEEMYIYDLGSETIQVVNGGAFFCLEEGDCVLFQEGPKSDDEALAKFNKLSEERSRKIASS